MSNINLIMNKEDVFPFGKEIAYSSKSIFDFFKCPNSGGILVSNERNAIVLIINPKIYYYSDKVLLDGKEILFCGQGPNGDQSFKQRNNKALLNSADKDVHLFVKEKKLFVYKGKVKVTDHRMVCMFSLVKEDIEP